MSPLSCELTIDHQGIIYTHTPSHQPVYALVGRPSTATWNQLLFFFCFTSHYFTTERSAKRKQNRIRTHPPPPQKKRENLASSSAYGMGSEYIFSLSQQAVLIVTCQRLLLLTICTYLYVTISSLWIRRGFLSRRLSQICHVWVCLFVFSYYRCRRGRSVIIWVRTLRAKACKICFPTLIHRPS